MRHTTRVLAALIALILSTAFLCDDPEPVSDIDGDGIPDGQDSDMDGDGVPNSRDANIADPTIGEPQDESDPGEASDEPRAAADDPEPNDEPAAGDDAESGDEAAAGDEAADATTPPLVLGGPSGADALLEIAAGILLDGEGRITLVADERLRHDAGWYGATINVATPEGVEAAIECSFRPDLEDEPTQCNAFILPNYECSVSHPFDDPGSGDVVMETPLYLDVNGVATFFATEPVPDGCTDITGATVTSGFFGQWDPVAGEGRSTTIEDFPGQLVDAWDNQP